MGKYTITITQWYAYNYIWGVDPTSKLYAHQGCRTISWSTNLAFVWNSGCITLKIKRWNIHVLLAVCCCMCFRSGVCNGLVSYIWFWYENQGGSKADIHYILCEWFLTCMKCKGLYIESLDLPGITGGCRVVLGFTENSWGIPRYEIWAVKLGGLKNVWPGGVKKLMKVTHSNPAFHTYKKHPSSKMNDRVIYYNHNILQLCLIHRFTFI